MLEQATKAELLISHVTTGGGVNALGVFADPLACQVELRAAQDEIEMALGGTMLMILYRDRGNSVAMSPTGISGTF